MSIPAGATTTYFRRGLVVLPPESVLAVVDDLDLRPGRRMGPAIGLPLRGLQQRRDVSHFASHAPVVAVRALLELMVAESLQRVVELLGDHADDPTLQQLTSAIDDLVAQGNDVTTVRALLALSIGEEFQAAPHCRQILDEREGWQLPDVEVVLGETGLLASHSVDPEIKEQRRRRREEAKQQRQSQKKSAPSRGRTKATPPLVTAHAPRVPAMAPPSRRVLRLTPLELSQFDENHPLVGWVILADVPFDATDPEIPDQTSKRRPALVVAGNASEVLVRAIYSKSQPWRALLTAWRRLRLDHPSYVDNDRVVVALPDNNDTVRLGVLSDEEWNALF